MSEDGRASSAGERERALDALRDQALAQQEEALARGRAPIGEALHASTSYHGLPVLKPPPWTWEVPLYFFVGGAAGAAAIVGEAARRAGADRALVRDARWIALSGAALSAPLLISDLGRPERFLHMLRVFKPQSAMSVGAWTLVAFSSCAAATLFADAMARRGYPVRLVEDAAGVLSALSGAVMATYTGVLLGVTAIPVWAQNARTLPVEFAASSLGAAVSALELRGHRDRALDTLGAAAAAVETATEVRSAVRPRSRALSAALRDGGSGTLALTGAALAGPVPLLLRLAGARRAAAVSALAGSLLLRYGWLEAGRASAADTHAALESA